MRRTMLTILFGLAPVASLALPASAYECSYGLARPYAIEETCDEDGSNCRARMIYAPGENPGLAAHGSYWYQRSVGYVRVVSDEGCGFAGLTPPHEGEGGKNVFGQKRQEP